MELARQGVAAIVIERSAYDDIRVGEHLAPAGVLNLRALDFRSQLPLDGHLASAGVDACWGSETPEHMDYFFHPGHHGLNLSRPQFDSDLARACESSGVTVLRSASLVHASRRGSRWAVDILIGGNVRSFSVSMVVDATGRAATFSRRQGAKVRAHDRQIAIVCFEKSSNGGIGSRSVVEAAETGWWYAAPIGRERRICMLVTDDDMLPKGAGADLQSWWLHQRDRTAQLCKHSPDFALTPRLIVRSARSQHIDAPAGTGWLAVGDAAMAFDPLTSYGIAKALDHGKRAASCIAPYLSGDASPLDRLAEQLKQEYASYCAERAQYYRLEQRWPGSVFWQRRHAEPVI